MADTLRTARLTLRPLQMADAPALHRFFTDPIAMEHWGKPHDSFEETQAWVAETIAAPATETCEFALERDGQLIGKAGVWKKPEVGYFLLPEHWGQGLMSEALATLLPHLHAALDTSILTAEISPLNHASAALLNKQSFKEVRRGKADYWDGAKWCDTIYFERHLS